MKFPFIGRAQELNLLDQLWEAPGAQFLVLYGRHPLVNPGPTSLVFTDHLQRRQSGGPRAGRFYLFHLGAGLASGRQPGQNRAPGSVCG